MWKGTTSVVPQGPQKIAALPAGEARNGGVDPKRRGLRSRILGLPHPCRAVCDRVGHPPVVGVRKGQSLAPSGTKRHDNRGHGYYGNSPRSIEMECAEPSQQRWPRSHNGWRFFCNLVRTMTRFGEKTGRPVRLSPISPHNQRLSDHAPLGA